MLHIGSGLLLTVSLENTAKTPANCQLMANMLVHSASKWEKIIVHTVEVAYSKL